ncbi:MAG: hypothetical protein AAF587_10760 [Bacteroidota bacterium]
MPTKFSNTLKDSLGIVRAVLYRTFIAHKWSTIQPMFNLLEVQEGKEALFEEFLKKSLAISLTYDTPISLGPYKTTEGRTYIYVTHYASTKAFLQVGTALLKKGVAAMRARATQWTSWTYCAASNSPDMSDDPSILMVGVQGDSSDFLATANRYAAQPLATVQKIADVRGKSLGLYLLFQDTPDNSAWIHAFQEEGGSIRIFQAKKLT